MDCSSPSSSCFSKHNRSCNRRGQAPTSISTPSSSPHQEHSRTTSSFRRGNQTSHDKNGVQDHNSPGSKTRDKDVVGYSVEVSNENTRYDNAPHNCVTHQGSALRNDTARPDRFLNLDHSGVQKGYETAKSARRLRGLLLRMDTLLLPNRRKRLV